MLVIVVVDVVAVDDNFVILIVAVVSYGVLLAARKRACYRLSTFETLFFYLFCARVCLFHGCVDSLLVVLSCQYTMCLKRGQRCSALRVRACPVRGGVVSVRVRVCV